MKTCDRVAEIVGEVARLGVPAAAALQCLRHVHRLVAESNRVDQRGLVAGATRDGDGLVPEREAFVEIRVPGALDAQQRQQARAVGAVRVAEPRERARLHVDALVVDTKNDAVPASVVAQCRVHEYVDGVDNIGEAAGREQSLAVRGITRLSLRVAKPEQ
jgi:hypothetical protein